MTHHPPTLTTLDALLTRARRLADDPRRRILGIAGAPGAGKSTVAQAVVAALGDRARLVAMDGFHLASAELDRLGRAGRKGAPDTFDADGYVALLRRLRDAHPAAGTVHAPEFRRAIEEPIAGAVAVDPEVALVVTEGLYLLLDAGPFAPVRRLLDEAWYCVAADDERLARLTARHMAYGRSPAEAAAWARGSDARNAELVGPTRLRADVLVRLPRKEGLRR